MDTAISTKTITQFVKPIEFPCHVVRKRLSTLDQVIDEQQSN